MEKEVTLKEIAEEYNIPVGKARRILRSYPVIEKGEFRWSWPKGSKDLHLVKAILLYQGQDEGDTKKYKKI